MAGSVNIYGQLHNASIGGYVVDTSEIIDTELKQTQEEINRQHTSQLEEHTENIAKVEELIPTAFTTIEYNKLKEKLPDKVYLVYKQDGTLTRIYVGSVLIAKRGEKGLEGFPYNFPIVF